MVPLAGCRPPSLNDDSGNQNCPIGTLIIIKKIKNVKNSFKNKNMWKNSSENKKNAEK
jgi:hypothetical protein